jgi:glycosyltransferase involved in cell wall biosynthesis
MAAAVFRRHLGMKRVLMVAYHFPPLAGSSGIQRTLRFVQQLPSLGWEPIVLTVRPGAYERTADDLTADVPPEIHVERTFALDAARHLAIAGRYPAFAALPDRWMSWRFSAVRAGMQLIQRYKPQVIWSTYPIATAHVIAHVLHRRSGLPWIADFRDPMAQEDYPPDPRQWKSFDRIEKYVLRDARFSVFTTPGAAREYRRRYPEAKQKIVVVENGYDEGSFADLGATPEPLNPSAVTLLHSGIVYPSERDPTALFAALESLAADGKIHRDELKIRFRAAAHEDILRALTVKHGLEGFIEILPPIGYKAALDEMVRADGLLVLQASNCNDQIPAKLYEYLRAGRPIVALTDPEGDTAGTLREAGIDRVARLDSVDEIAALIASFATVDADRSALVPDRAYAAGATRTTRARALSALLDQAIVEH